MPSIFVDRTGCTSFRTVQRVTVDQVDQMATTPKSVVCLTGRIPGSRVTFAYAKVEGTSCDLTAAECRELAASLLVAADVLEGKQEAEEITRRRVQYEEQCRQLTLDSQV